MRIFALMLVATCLSFNAVAQEKGKAQDEKTTEQAPTPSVGKEIGAAVNQVITAVVKDGNKLATSEIGVFTIGLVAWKVMAKPIVRFSVGILLMWGLLWIWWWSYRKTSLTHVVVATESAAERKYKLVQPVEGRALAHGFVLIVILVGSYVLMFA